MGLLGEGINEVIATTRGNAAPIGVICRGGSFRMVLFEGTHTLANIKKEGWVVANLIHDPVIYVKTAFEDIPDNCFCDEEAAGLSVQRLKGASAWVVFRAEIAKESLGASSVELFPVEEHIISERLFPVNRGFNSIIEATVHGTRYVENYDPELASLIDHHASIVRKCGGRREMEALDLLLGFIGR